MAYTPPTASDIKLRFPEFADQDDTYINAIIQEAMRYVDNSWIEADYPIALRFLTAHMMAMEGALNEGGAVAVVNGLIKSESLGDASITYQDRAGSGDVRFLELTSTTYGQRFLAIHRSNHPAVVVV